MKLLNLLMSKKFISVNALNARIKKELFESCSFSPVWISLFLGLILCGAIFFFYFFFPNPETLVRNLLLVLIQWFAFFISSILTLFREILGDRHEATLGGMAPEKTPSSSQQEPSPEGNTLVHMDGDDSFWGNLEPIQDIPSELHSSEGREAVGGVDTPSSSHVPAVEGGESSRKRKGTSPSSPQLDASGASRPRMNEAAGGSRGPSELEGRNRYDIIDVSSSSCSESSSGARPNEPANQYEIQLEKVYKMRQITKIENAYQTHIINLEKSITEAYPLLDSETKETLKKKEVSLEITRLEKEIFEKHLSSHCVAKMRSRMPLLRDLPPGDLQKEKERVHLMISQLLWKLGSEPSHKEIWVLKKKLEDFRLAKDIMRVFKSE